MEISYNPTYSPTASESESPQHHSTREQQKKSVLLRRFVNAVIKSLPTVISADCDVCDHCNISHTTGDKTGQSQSLYVGDGILCGRQWYKIFGWVT